MYNICLSGYENTTQQSLRGPLKMALRGRFIALCTYIQYFEISQINNLMMYLQAFERQEKIKSLYNILGEIIKIRAKINKTEAN